MPTYRYTATRETGEKFGEEIKARTMRGAIEQVQYRLQVQDPKTRHTIKSVMIEKLR